MSRLKYIGCNMSNASEKLIAIIGGTGLTEYPDLFIEKEEMVETALGKPRLF